MGLSNCSLLICKILWIETPSNPTLKCCDIEKLCQLARKHGLVSIVDNTFATPYLQSPILLGADIVLHSCTKYIGGHTDLLMGAICLNDKELYEKLSFISKSTSLQLSSSFKRHYV